MKAVTRRNKPSLFFSLYIHCMFSARALCARIKYRKPENRRGTGPHTSLHARHCPTPLPSHPCTCGARDRADIYKLVGSSGALTRLEEQNRDLSQVEVDKVLGLVCYVRAEVTADDTVPGGVVLLVELLLDVGSNILKTAIGSSQRMTNSLGLHNSIHVPSQCCTSPTPGTRSQPRLAACPQTYQRS